MLKVEFEKHDDEYVVEGTDLPNKYIENVRSNIICKLKL